MEYLCFEVLGLNNLVTQMDLNHASADSAQDVIIDVSINPEMLQYVYKATSKVLVLIGI